MNLRVFILTITLSVCATATAQLTRPALPAQRPESGFRSTSSLEYKPLPAGAANKETASKQRKCVMGETVDVQWNIKDGEYFEDPEGRRVWRLGVQAPGAESIGLMMSGFHLPEGAFLLLYSPDGNVLHGGYGADNNASDSLLAIAPFPGDSLIAEYQEPADAPFGGSVVIGAASRNFRSINNFGISKAECAPHTATEARIADARRGVVDLYVYDANEAWACTAWMPANTERRPYLCTAYHCMSGRLNPDRLARRSVVYFNYEVPAPDTTVQGSIEQTLSGLSYVAGFDSIDFALAAFADTPPRDYRPYRLGWTVTDAPGGDLTCIQHPYGDSKRVSYCAEAPSTITLSGSDYSPCFVKNGYWHIARWTQGTTEAGSSGSPLLTSGLLVTGSLTGGDSDCDLPVDDYFSRFDLAWDYSPDSTRQLKCWLDPSGSGVTRMEGEEAYATPCTRATHISAGQATASPHLPAPASGLLAGHNSLGHDAFAERFAFNAPQTLYGLYLIPDYGRYNPGSPVYACVYDGDEKPGNLRARQLIMPYDLSSFNTSADTFRTSLKQSWYGKETYVRFNEPLEMDSVFFIGYEIGYGQLTASDSFGVRSLAETAEQNTAWFRSDDEWTPYTGHPALPAATSLWIDAVSVSGRVSAVSETEVAHERRVWPNPCRKTVRWDGSSTPYRLIDLQGRQVDSGTGNTATLPDTPGVYLLRLRGETRWETHKILRLP